MMPADATEDVMKELSLANEDVQKAVDGRPIRKVICVQGRLVNIVA